MREILFRGRTIVNHQWVEGFFMKSPAGKCYIYDSNLRPFLVDPSSVGQFTGLYDHSDPKKRIFEGDILRVNEDEGLNVCNHEVKYGDDDSMSYPAFHLSPSFDCDENDLQYVLLDTGDKREVTIVGNIIDNPGLL